MRVDYVMELLNGLDFQQVKNVEELNYDKFFAELNMNVNAPQFAFYDDPDCTCI
jgi:hypothetical protein